jgi:hypothetical protein
LLAQQPGHEEAPLVGVGARLAAAMQDRYPRAAFLPGASVAEEAASDFSNITATGTSFSNAILVGAKFTGAKLDWASQSSTRTSLTGAFIGGANFGGSATTVAGANFTNAYVDFAPNGATWFFILDSALTEFPGFDLDPDDNPLGHQPCVHFSFGDPTTVPTSTDQNNVCVDGKAGPCGDATNSSWTSPTTPYDQHESSRSTDDPTACTFDQIDWSW